MIKLVWLSQDSGWLGKGPHPHPVPFLSPCSAQLRRCLPPAEHSWSQPVTYPLLLDPPVIHNRPTHPPVPGPMGLTAPSAQGAPRFHYDKPLQLRSYSFPTTPLSNDHSQVLPSYLWPHLHSSHLQTPVAFTTPVPPSARNNPWLWLT